MRRNQRPSRNNVLEVEVDMIPGWEGRYRVTFDFRPGYPATTHDPGEADEATLIKVEQEGPDGWQQITHHTSDLDDELVSLILKEANANC